MAPPKNLEEAMTYIKNEWSTIKYNSFKSKPEKEAVSDEHFG